MGLVDGNLPVQQHAVHGDALARADPKHLAAAHLADGDDGFLPVPKHGYGIGRERHQFADRVGGAALGARFQPAAQGDEGQDHHGGFKIQVMRKLVHPHALRSGHLQ